MKRKRITNLFFILVIVSFMYFYDLYIVKPKLDNIILRKQYSISFVNSTKTRRSIYENYVSLKVKATAYNSETAQTDSSPFICAWGDRVRDGIIAISNDLEILGLTRGDEVFINGKKYVIMDRMHPRKKKQIDIWMPRKKDAISFGVKHLYITIPKNIVNKLCSTYPYYYVVYT